MRAALYARFSSDLQDVRSIGDQIRLARERAAREGWQVVAEYSDAAISGASIANRPDLQRMMADAALRRFDVIVTESVDRISRNLADISAIWEDLAYLEIRMHTLAEGEIGFMHIGLKGIVGQMFLSDLAHKTRRGHVGRLRQGRVPGGRCYGYDVVPGEEKGLRTINAIEAAVIQRIFALYDSGLSARSIAAILNAEGIQAPNGRPWSTSTINGSAKRGCGILQNRLYVGEIVYGRQKFEKNPRTGKRIGKSVPKNEWLVEPAPQLAIVDRELFDRVAAKRAKRAETRPERQRRPKHMLSGLLACGCCGGPLIAVKPGRYGCSFFRNRATCTNNRTILIAEVERRLLGAMKEHLLAPDIVAAAVEAYREERARLAATRQQTARASERKRLEIEGKITRIVRAIEDGTASPSLLERLSELEAERADLPKITREIADNVLDIHPRAANSFRQKVENIQQALAKGDAAGHEAVSLVRELIARIVTTPEGGPHGGGAFSMVVEGNLAAILHLDSGMTADDAGSRYHRTH